MTLAESIVAWLGASGVAAMPVAVYARRVVRSYWWSLALHTALAATLRLVRPLRRDAMVHGLKRALLEVVSPPVAARRRVPARIEVVVPDGVPIEPGMAVDLGDWLVEHARRSGWALPARGRVTVTIRTGQLDRSARPRARVTGPRTR